MVCNHSINLSCNSFLVFLLCLGHMGILTGSGISEYTFAFVYIVFLPDLLLLLLLLKIISDLLHKMLSTMW